MKITILASEIHADLGLARLYTKEEQFQGLAAPFILCKLVEQHPLAKRRNGRQTKNKRIWVQWDFEIEAMSPTSAWLAYEPDKQELYDTVTGPGGGHGTCYSGVNNALLLKLYKDALRRKTTINLNRLRRFGCRIDHF